MWNMEINIKVNLIFEIDFFVVGNVCSSSSSPKIFLVFSHFTIEFSFKWLTIVRKYIYLKYPHFEMLC